MWRDVAICPYGEVMVSFSLQFESLVIYNNFHILVFNIHCDPHHIFVLKIRFYKYNWSWEWIFCKLVFIIMNFVSRSDGHIIDIFGCDCICMAADAWKWTDAYIVHALILSTLTFNDYCTWRFQISTLMLELSMTQIQS